MMKIPSQSGKNVQREEHSTKIRIAILFSGHGSNMNALARYVHERDDAEIVLTLCNRPQAAGIHRANALGLRCEVIDHKAYPTRAAFEGELIRVLEDAHAELICAAGFMRLLSAGFVNRWSDRILNIHPSLLPKYRGLDTHRRAIEDNAYMHGCTVHYMRPSMDDGPILVQKPLVIRPDDTPDTLATRVLALEHQAYPEALAKVLETIQNTKHASNIPPEIPSADNLVRVKKESNLFDGSLGRIRTMN